FDIHADQISEQHRGGADVGLAQRHHGKLEWQSSSFPNTTFDMLGDLAKMCIAGREFRPGIADTDDRSSIKHMVGKPLVAHPAAVHETIFVRLSEPRGGAILAFLVSHESCSPFC